MRSCDVSTWRSGGNDDLSELRRALLDARERRQADIARARRAGRTVISLSVNMPGADKCRPGVRSLARLAGEALARDAGAEVVVERADALGPWAIAVSALSPRAAKDVSVAIEAALPAGRLVDLDVHDAAGRQVDRASIGLAPRPCLICDRPAVECMRLERHPVGAAREAADRLLLRVLASLLLHGARTELDLTPKPGLVDRLDNGSHPDLSFDAMSRSIDLLALYLDDLLALGEPPDLDAAVAAGIRAERRMIEAIGSNTHKGYIYLAGLALLAAREAADPAALRAGIASIARRLLDVGRPGPGTPASPTHGADARASHGVGGIVGEALLGLPSVFERGLPALGMDVDRSAGGHRLMAVLMQSVEDTTAIHRGGLSALARLRADGAELQRRIDARDDWRPWLAALNDDYRRLNLTMGGVADCMALCFALHEWFGL